MRPINNHLITFSIWASCLQMFFWRAFYSCCNFLKSKSTAKILYMLHNHLSFADFATCKLTNRAISLKISNAFEGPRNRRFRVQLPQLFSSNGESFVLLIHEEKS